MLHPDILKYSRELAFALRNFKYEQTEQGDIYVPAGRLLISGVYGHDVNGQDYREDKNLIPTQGLNHILTIVVANGTQVTTWYIAPFSGNVTVLATWTAANFTSNSTEFTNYDESTRVQYQEGTASSGSINNSSNKAAFTIASGGGTVWGAGMLSVSTKSATTGTLLSAAKFSSARTLVEDDVINIQYTLTLTSS